MRTRLGPASRPVDLRRRAEKQLAGKHNRRLLPLGDQDAQRLLHELQVHQIELGLQNEELRSTRDRLEVALAKYHDLYDHAPVGYITLDRQGVVQEANLAAALLLGRRRERVVGQSILGFVCGSSQPACKAFVRGLSEGIGKQDCEVVVALARCGPFHIQLNGTAVDSVGAQSPEARVVLLDVTARERAEEALRIACDVLERRIESRTEELARAHAGLKTSQDRLARAQRAARIGVWEYDLVTGSTFWSEELYDLLEMAPTNSAPSLGTLAEVLHPDDSSLLSPLSLEEHLRANVIDIVCRIIARKSKALRYVRVCGSVTRDADGRRVMVIGTVQDVTEQRPDGEAHLAMERRTLESQRMENLGLMAGGIAHDFNNFLQGVRGNAELALLEAEPHSPVIRRLDAIEATTERLSGLTRQLLALSGKGRGVVEPTCLNQVVEDTSRLLAVSLPKKAILKPSLSEGLPAVDGDTVQLGQVLMNLVINAAEALGGDVGTIEMRTEVVEWQRGAPSEFVWSQQLPDGSYVCLEVADTGCGMDAETLRRGLEPFFSTKSAGRGMGLPSVLGIVRGHGGALGVSSVPGVGTTFRVLLPCSQRGPTQRSTPSHVRELWRTSGLVLLADDEPEVQAMTEAMLTHIGFDVVLASNGKAAVDIMAKRGHEVRLVVLDLSMPLMDGLQAMVEIRRSWPSVRVVLASGYAEEDTSRRYGGMGFSGFLQKPYGFGRLIETVRAALQDAGSPVANRTA